MYTHARVFFVILFSIMFITGYWIQSPVTLVYKYLFPVAVTTFQLFGVHTRSGTAESYGGSVFHFLRNLQLFSTAAAAFSVPTSRAQEFQFLHILTNTCSFSGFWF